MTDQYGSWGRITTSRYWKLLQPKDDITVVEEAADTVERKLVPREEALAIAREVARRDKELLDRLAKH